MVATRNYKFKVHGFSDSDYAKDPETRRSVSGYATFLNGAPVDGQEQDAGLCDIVSH